MAVYAIGDVQGCLAPLRRLLYQIAFDPARDRLWFAGDLVNRGPDSLEVLRLARDLGPAALTVLGNHDLHLLAIAAGAARPKRRDTLDAVLNAPDRDALLDWLRAQPLLHHDPRLGYTLVHAGLLPQWDLPLALSLAAEVEAVLRGPDHRDFLTHMYGDQPDHWEPDLRGTDRLRVILNACTRLRYCDANGRMDLGPKGAPGTQAPHLLPWFAVPDRRSADLRILFGHWSTLGCWQGAGTTGLDSGCVWGQALTAARLDPDGPTLIRVPCAQLARPQDAPPE
jgi:bis(5'-nucleosyl)-tetraphosphatase (symmetrical)